MLLDAMEKREKGIRRFVGNGQYNFYVEEMGQRAVSFVVDLAKAFEKVQFKVAWDWRCALASRDTFCVFSLGICSCSEGRSLKDAWRNRYRPSPRSFQTQNGLYRFFFLEDRYARCNG